MKPSSGGGAVGAGVAAGGAVSVGAALPIPSVGAALAVGSVVTAPLLSSRVAGAVEQAKKQIAAEVEYSVRIARAVYSRA
jgi:hypothetical protein